MIASIRIYIWSLIAFGCCCVLAMHLLPDHKLGYRPVALQLAVVSLGSALFLAGSYLLWKSPPLTPQAKELPCIDS